MRQATAQDVPLIMEGLLAMLEESPAPQMAMATPIAAELSIRHAIHEGRTRIIDDFFIMFDIAVPWYAETKVLVEDIILRITMNHNTKVQVAIDALDVIAAEYGCEKIATGDTQIGYMTPKYLASGYQLMGSQFIKGVKRGISSQDHRGAGTD
jgi:hypothetical protein